MSLKYFLVALSSLVFALVLIALSIFIFPEVVLNKNNLEWVQNNYLKQYQVPWDKIEIDIRAIALGEYYLKLQGKDFCIKDTGSKSSYCFLNLQSSAEIHLIPSPKIIPSKLLLHSDEIVHVSELSEDTKSNELEINIVEQNELLKEILTQFKTLKPEDFNIKFDNMLLKNSETSSVLSMNADNQNLAFNIKATNFDANLKARLEASSWKTKIGFTSADVRLHSNLTLRIRDKLLIDAQNQVWFPSFADKIKSPMSFDLSYIGSKDSVDIELSKLSVYSKTEQNNLKAHCKLNIPRSEEAVFSCDTKLQVVTPKLKDTALSFSLNGGVVGQFSHPISLDNNLSELASFKLDLDGVSEQQYDLKAQLEASLYASDISTKFQLEDLEFKLSIVKYQKFYHLLAQLGIIVPAPFHSLKGSADFQIKDFEKESDNTYRIPFSVALNLDESKFNQVNVYSDGEFFASPQEGNKLIADVTIDKLYLYLPKIDPLRGIPPLRKDKRILKDTSELSSEKEASLRYDIQLKTNGLNPIRIYHYTLDPYLGLQLEASLGSNISYKLKKSPHRQEIEYIKRRLEIEKFGISKNKNRENGELNLSLIYLISGYKIFVNVGGELDSPILSLNSEPSLSREDIISVILFGKTSSNLASFQKNSVGNTEAAVADRALGLLSIWAFASTPIESVSYDPSQKTYSASIALPDGVNLKIGTDWEQLNSVSLRKYLKNGWSVMTTYEPSELDQDKSDIMLKKEITY